MRAVLQRVSRASVTVQGNCAAAIAGGLLVLLGVGPLDTAETASQLALKTARLRIFADAAGRMNRSLLDTGGAALVVSQFTLLADTKHGNRPSFTGAMAAEAAAVLVDRFTETLAREGVPVSQGVFGAHMQVELLNDGPVTIILEG